MPIDRALRLVDAELARTPAHARVWGWEDAVFLRGVDALRPFAPRMTRALVDAHRAFVRRGLPTIDRADVCAPAISALAVAAELPAAMASAERVAAYLATAPRNRVGGVDHLGRSPLRWLYPSSLWVDSLAMSVTFAARWGAETRDATFVDFAASQPIVYAAALQDDDTGLFRHAYLVRARRAVPRGFWLRGNAWALASLVDIVEVTPPDHADRDRLVAIARRLARALATTPWDRLLGGDDTAGAALVAYALAKGARLGALDPALRDAAASAFARADARVVETPRGLSMRGITGPTNALPAFAYRLVPEAPDAPYGIGAYALAAAELERG